MFSSGTSSPVSADTFFRRMRLIVRSSSWLNDTLFLLTAWNSLTGMATNPKLIVPLHTGLGMADILPYLGVRQTAPRERERHDAPTSTTRRPGARGASEHERP